METLKYLRRISMILFLLFLVLAIYCYCFNLESLSMETIARRPLYLVLSIVFLTQFITASAIVRDFSERCSACAKGGRGNP